MEKKAYYSIDPGGKLKCRKCNVPLEKGRARFMYLDNGFPVELPLCPPKSSANGVSASSRMTVPPSSWLPPPVFTLCRAADSTRCVSHTC